MNDKINDLCDIHIFENCVLGSGYISSVYLGEHKTTKERFAIKIVA